MDVGESHRRQDGGQAVGLDHWWLKPTFPPRQGIDTLCEFEHPHAMAGVANIPSSPDAADGAASPERSPTDAIDDVVDTGHPRHAGEHEVHTGVMRLRRGGGTAIPHHHALIIQT
jgi:hypothetical protein